MAKRRKNRKKQIFFNRVLVLLLALLIVFATVKIVGKIFAPQADTDNVTNEANQENTSNIETNENETSTDSTSSKEDEIKDIEITISAVGDIMFHPKEINGAYNSETDSYDFKPFFEEVKTILDKADLAVGNYEGTSCGDDIYRYQGYPLFNAPDEVLDAMKYAGLDLLCTINNHSLDTGKEGVIRTYNKLNDRDLNHVGTNLSKNENRVRLVDVKGVKVAFLAYTEMLNGLESRLTADELGYMVNVFDENKIIEDIKFAKDNGADAIIMFAHWGYEYHRKPNQNQINWTDFALKNGVDIILGSHPHVIQPFKFFSKDEENIEDNYGEDKFVAYSMGNFVSNQRMEECDLDPQTEDGVITNITLRKNIESNETKIVKVEYEPTWVYRTFDGENYHYKILLVNENIENNDLDESVLKRIRRSKKDTEMQLQYVNQDKNE